MASEFYHSCDADLYFWTRSDSNHHRGDIIRIMSKEVIGHGCAINSLWLPKEAAKELAKWILEKEERHDA